MEFTSLSFNKLAPIFLPLGKFESPEIIKLHKRPWGTRTEATQFRKKIVENLKLHKEVVVNLVDVTEPLTNGFIDEMFVKLADEESPISRMKTAMPFMWVPDRKTERLLKKHFIAISALSQNRIRK
jgi:hypothetical protein